MLRAARPRSIVVIGLSCAAMVAALAACRGGNSQAEERRYQAAREAFIGSLRADSAALAGPIAAAYVTRRAAGEESPGDDVIRQFQGQYEEFNQTYCQHMKTIGETISAGSRGRAPYRIDEALVLARDLVFDSIATALLQSVLAAPPDQHDQLLGALGVRAVRARDGTEFFGIAALQEAGLLDPNGHIELAELDTAEYTRYQTWAYREAKGFASRVGVLIEPTESKKAECLPPR